jgi:hypothetical protein
LIRLDVFWFRIRDPVMGGGLGCVGLLFKQGGGAPRYINTYQLDMPGVIYSRSPRVQGYIYRPQPASSTADPPIQGTWANTSLVQLFNSSYSTGPAPCLYLFSTYLGTRVGRQSRYFCSYPLTSNSSKDSPSRSGHGGRRHGRLSGGPSAKALVFIVHHLSGG